MTIETVQFNLQNQHKYDPLLDVFRESLARNMPDIPLVEHILNPPAEIPMIRKVSYWANTYKLKRWEKIIRNASEPVILADCDMVCLRDISNAFCGDFDIAYTVRTNKRLPLNGGLIFVKPTAASRRFFAMFRATNERMYWDPLFHEKWKHKTAGMNQAAFWYVVKKVDHGAKLMTLPCEKWNACDEDWPHVNGLTRMLHIKGRLRWAVLGNLSDEKMPPELARAAAIWREYV